MTNFISQMTSLTVRERIAVQGRQQTAQISRDRNDSAFNTLTSSRHAWLFGGAGRREILKSKSLEHQPKESEKWPVPGQDIARPRLPFFGKCILSFQY